MVFFFSSDPNVKVTVLYQGGVVELSVEYRTRDQEVVGSSLGRARGVETLGMFLTPMCLCSPSGWGVKAGMVYVWMPLGGR